MTDREVEAAFPVGACVNVAPHSKGADKVSGRFYVVGHLLSCGGQDLYVARHPDDAFDALVSPNRCVVTR